MAGLWGLAEATFFFIIPDVWFCGVAVRYGARAGLISLATALVFALGGGILLHQWSAFQPDRAAAAVRAVPGIRPGIFLRADRHLQGGPLGMAVGGFTFLPYKVYAVQAPGAGVHPPQFLALSLLNRIPRFLVCLGLTLLAAALLRRWAPVWIVSRLMGVHLVFWAVIYGLYFTVVVPRL